MCRVLDLVACFVLRARQIEQRFFLLPSNAYVEEVLVNAS
jgi:hypothetical protein